MPMTKRAMIIDDSRAMRAVVGRKLREVNFEVFEFENGGAALAWLAEHGPVDVGLVDLYMPEVDGYEFVRRLRGESRYDTMRVLMVTSESDLEQVRRVLEAGADEYLMKPFADDALSAKLQILGLL